MFCKNCGNRLTNNFLFCEYCGESISRFSQAESTIPEIINSMLSGKNSIDGLNSYSFCDSRNTFLMTVDDKFIINGRGVVATGEILNGDINVGDTVSLYGKNTISDSIVTGIEKNRILHDFAKKGDKPGLLLRGMEFELPISLICSNDSLVQLENSFYMYIVNIETLNEGDCLIINGYNIQHEEYEIYIDEILDCTNNLLYQVKCSCNDSIVYISRKFFNIKKSNRVVGLAFLN